MSLPRVAWLAQLQFCVSSFFGFDGFCVDAAEVVSVVPVVVGQKSKDQEWVAAEQLPPRKTGWG